MEETTMLKLDKVDICREENVILHRASFTLHNGEFVYVIGKVGSGKSSLLKSLYCEIPINQGDAWLLDYNLCKMRRKDIPYLRRKLGIVFQDFQLFPHLSVLENLILSPIKTQNMSRSDAEDKARKLLDTLGLANHATAYPFSLSGGQKQRVALARAMMIDPEIIGYDEPTSALDPELRKEVEKLILENRATGITQIVVTHDMQFAENIADEIIKIEPKH